MRASRATDLRVGIFVVVCLVIGGTVAFAIGNRRNLWAEKVTYRSVFDSVSGLRAGSPVQIAGVAVGTVTAVKINPADRKIHVEMEIVEDATTLIRGPSRAGEPDGSVTSIGSKGMLGDKLVDITVGHGAPIPVGGFIPSSTGGDLMSQLQGSMGKINELITELRDAAGPLLRDEQFTRDIRAITHNLAEVSRMAAEEDGTVRRLFTDPEMANSIEQTLANVRTTSDELSRTSRSVRSIIHEVETGDGFAHEIVYGAEGRRLLTNLANVSGEMATLLGDVRTGDGLAHDLIYENDAEELMDNMTAISGDMRAIVSDVRAGRGTIGGLLVDPSIYEDVKRLVGDLERNQVLRALVRYSIREDEPRPTPAVDD